MNKLISFVKLDILTIKPYLTIKNLIILSVAAAVMSMTGSSSAMSMVMVFSAVYVSYPFAVGESNSIDMLYSILSINRNTVVSGRYIFALIVDIVGALLGLFLSFTFSIIFKNDFVLMENLLYILIFFIMFSLTQAVQIPLFFKLGYTKAKLYANLPLLTWPLAVVLIAGLLNNPDSSISINIITFIYNNVTLLIIGLAIVYVCCILFSYKLSLKYYENLDL